jgi:hypothetical protein
MVLEGLWCQKTLIKLLTKFLLSLKTSNVSEAGSAFLIKRNGEREESTLVGSLESAGLNLGTKHM